MVKRKLGALEKVEADLPNLQHKIRRDPLSYKGDFLNQYEQYQTFYQLVLQSPAAAPTDNLISLRDLIDFISHVAQCYPDLTSKFPQDLISLLSQHHGDLEPELREKIVGSLVLLRKNKVIDSPTLLNTLFPLLISTPSKQLRVLLYQKILSDIRNSNAKATNHQLNRMLQTVLFNIVTADRTSAQAIWAVRITREMWRRQIWTDSKAVEIMKEAALAENPKVTSGGVQFFLGGDKEREEAAEEISGDEEDIDVRKIKHQLGIKKKSRKNEKQLQAARATVKKRERKKNQPHALNFSALHLLHDPQGFAETLFARHLQSAKSRLNLEGKLKVLQLVSRLVGLHKLTIVSLYSYFLKYLTPKQASVTSFLASLAQSSHNLVPPDVLEPLILKIANEFVSEAAASQVAAAGLNAIREVCARQPLAMNETLLQDLIMYRKSKDKGVSMAAKGLLSLYRDAAPDMLKRRDRGRDASMNMRESEWKQQRFGEAAVGGIEGLDLLEKYKDEERRKKREELGLDPDGQDGDEQADSDDEDDWKAWEVQDEDSDDSGGWINVESDGEDLHISDSDDEKPPHKKKAKANASVSDEAKDNTKENATGDTDLNDSEIKDAQEFSKLATTRILTPADLAKLNELRMTSAVQKLLPKHKKASTAEWHADNPVTAEDMEAVAALGKKMTKEDKIALAKGDKDVDHRGRIAKRKERKQESGKSSTNKEKQRKKNMMMLVGKARGKQKRSLQEVGKVLKGHVSRQKKGGRRGNRS